ncbi:MAG TPA: dinitrogenase iron-molybdenum cofactor biosynthesis protein [Clostridia bacterium]|jgi:predicted Fe-Mo cluster-binding NifX family protein|nr:dinitrogenase iron-molybdenum cofactor biosynthesis protein [Clostridia bacterium]
MKIAVSTTGESLDSLIDERFGRTSQFLLYDLEKNTYSLFDNKQNRTAPQGAGIQTAQNIINAKADVVITGNVGPKAFRTLNAGKIKVYLATGITVREALEQYKKGLLPEAQDSNVEGHWL